MKNMALITVFTPTYNRSQTLSRTFQSLCAQTSREFCWLIIDDGSSDNTRNLVDEWRHSQPGFDINYIFKQNGGLHTGYNKAIEIITTELCICVDSDDYLPENAIKIIYEYWNANRNDVYAGIIGLDFFSGSNKPIGGYFPSRVKEGHLTDLRYIHNHHGDVKIVCRTELLKRFWPMPSFNGEKNFNPIYYYLQVDSNYKFLYINENLCFVDYQPAGMTANIYNQFYNSPYSFAALRELHMSLKRIPWKVRFKNAIHYVSCCMIARDLSLLKSTKNKGMVFSALLFGLVLYFIIVMKKK